MSQMFQNFLNVECILFGINWVLVYFDNIECNNYGLHLRIDDCKYFMNWDSTLPSGAENTDTHCFNISLWVQFEEVQKNDQGS